MKNRLRFFKLIDYIVMLPVLAFGAYILYSRSKYRKKSGAGAFFFENGSLVLNTGIPYAVPLDEIECVELHLRCPSRS